MSGRRLVAPEDAVAAIRRKIDLRWADAVCADLGVGDRVTFSVPLRPGVSTGKAVEQTGHAVWHDWHTRWRAFADQLPAGMEIVCRTVTIRGVPGAFPATLVATLDTMAGAPDLDVDRARALASALLSSDAILTPANLRAAYRLPATDVEVLVNAVRWLRLHPDVTMWTARQLPVPGMHTKWLDTHGTLLRDVTGRDVRAEVRARPTVVHLTYVDPGHIASGRRRHDAWTTGDVHDIAYQPRVVLVVENRDSRLWFPPVDDTIVVEGGGKAAAALLATVPWIRAADHVVYWGDIDADGYAILDQFRAALAEPAPYGAPAKRVASILMDVRPAPLLPARHQPRQRRPSPQAVVGEAAPPHRSRGNRVRHHRDRWPHSVPTDRTGSHPPHLRRNPTAGGRPTVRTVTTHATSAKPCAHVDQPLLGVAGHEVGDGG